MWTILILQIIFWVSVLALFHTYLFYPLILKFLAWNNISKDPSENNTDDHAKVSFVMSLYNEEKVIADKLDCLLDLDYPKDQIDFFIGSDCSDDQTNPIVNTYAKDKRIHFFPFEERRGKPGVVNDLVAKAIAKNGASQDHILILTDANVMLEKSTLKKFIRHFNDPDLALVDSNMVAIGMKKTGISHSERNYVNAEVMLKNREGQVWGTMIGPFGGCYALRSDFYHPVPDNYLVDDFYIAMKAFEKGSKAINDLDAICYEAVSHEIKEEYRRKSRISAGNWQNLKTFRHLLWPPYNRLAFAFLSHKVLRWLGPFFILFAWIISGILAINKMSVYLFLFGIITTILIIIPILDTILKGLKLNILPIRNVKYFVSMNIALLEGFFKYLKGIKSNVWQPPKRH